MSVDDRLNADHADAILRDPNVPADVRAFVLTVHNVGRYLDSVDFQDDGNGFLTVVPASEPAEVPAEQTAPAQSETSVEAGSDTVPPEGGAEQ